jgi:drug/metabolite transporter (DMT)-like permease
MRAGDQEACDTRRRHPSRGYFYIATATFLWGVSATLGRAAFTGRLLPGGAALRPIDPLILSQSRTTFSFLTFFLVLGARRGWKQLRLPLPDVGRAILLGILGIAASNYLYYLAIQRTNVATAIILQYTAPVWVLLYAILRGIQKPSVSRIAAALLALVGIGLVIDVFHAGSLRLDKIGVAAALLAAFSFAFYNVAGHSLLERYDRWIVLLYTTFAASLFWIVINPPAKIIAARYSGYQWLFLMVFSVTSMLGPFSFYFAGLQHLEPTRAIVVSCLEPVFSILIAAVALGEAVHSMQALGIVIVLAAILVVQRPEDGTLASVTAIEPIE